MNPFFHLMHDPMRFQSDWEVVQLNIQKTCAVFAVILNTFLVFLILCKSPKDLGAYKYLMIFISIVEILFSISEVLVCPVFHHTGFTFLIISRITRFAPFVQLALNGAYSGLFGSLMALFGIHFIYRYLVIKKHWFLSTFQDWRLVVWFSIPVVFGTTWGLIAIFCCGPREVTNKLIETDILEKLDLRIDEITYIGPYFYDELGGYYLPAVIGLSVDCVIIGTSFFAVTVFCYLCFKELKKYSKKSWVSERNKVLQSQLYYALVAQTLIPIILLQLPTFLLFVTVFCELHIGEISGIVSITIAIYPAIDPFPTMFIVTSYRKAIIEYFEGSVKTIVTPFGLHIRHKQRSEHCDNSRI